LDVKILVRILQHFKININICYYHQKCKCFIKIYVVLLRGVQTKWNVTAEPEETYCVPKEQKWIAERIGMSYQLKPENCSYNY